MAKVVIVGGFERKGSYCPQCRKRVPSENRQENGITCPRCGFFRWEEFKKYPSFIDVPEPTRTDIVAVDKIITDKEGELEETRTKEAEDQQETMKEKIGIETEIVQRGTKRPVVRKKPVVRKTVLEETKEEEK